MWTTILVVLAVFGVFFLLREGLKVITEFVRSLGLRKVNISAEFVTNEKPPKQLNK